MNIDKLKGELRGNPLHLKERLDINDKNARKIGYGHDLNLSPLPAGWTMPITFDKAEALLVLDVRRIEHECEQRLSMWSQRDPARKMATAILVYHLGIEAVAKMQMVNMYIRQGLFSHAADSIEASEFARSEPEVAARVAAMLRTGRET